MSRILVAARTTPGSYPTLPVTANSLDVTLQAADTTNHQYTPLVDGKTMVVAYNSGAGAHTITINSATDTYGRTGDITTYSLGAAEMAIFGPFKALGWSQSGTQLWFEANHAEILFAVITLP